MLEFVVVIIVYCSIRLFPCLTLQFAVIRAIIIHLQHCYCCVFSVILMKCFEHDFFQVKNENNKGKITVKIHWHTCNVFYSGFRTLAECRSIFRATWARRQKSVSHNFLQYIVSNHSKNRKTKMASSLAFLGPKMIALLRLTSILLFFCGSQSQTNKFTHMEKDLGWSQWRMRMNIKFCFCCTKNHRVFEKTKFQFFLCLNAMYLHLHTNASIDVRNTKQR